MKEKVGTIKRFIGSWGSGIAQLVVEDDQGHTDVISCENGPTVKALDRMFPGFIKPGHVVDPNAIIGHRISYGIDMMGLLHWLEAN